MSKCAFCGLERAFGDPLWAESVNLTPDVLGWQTFDFVGRLVGVDAAVDWCNIECFGRWLYRAVLETPVSFRGGKR